MLVERFYRENHIPSDLKWLNELNASIPVAEGSFRLLQKCEYLGTEGVAAVNDALRFAHEYHSQHSDPPKKAIRDDGKEYTTHLLAVTEILADLRCDQTTLTAGLLHDTLENTSVTREMLSGRFGEEVARTVDTVTKVAGSTTETLVKVIQGLKDNPRAILVKLADRLHNMRTISFLPEKKQKKIAHQTLQVFAPFAREVGLVQIADELYDLSYGALWKKEYQEAKKIIESGYNEERTVPIISALQHLLPSDAVKPMISVKALVPPVHSLIHFKNHAVTVGDSGVIPIEIICGDTNEFNHLREFFQTLMTDFALEEDEESGCLNFLFHLGDWHLSLFIYTREGFAKKDASLATLFSLSDVSEEMRDELIGHAETKLQKPLALVGQLSEYGPEGVLRRFSEAIKYPLIGVVTPIGEIRVLSEGSTALDFAFSLSSSLGLKAQEAFVNGESVSLSTDPLKEGDRVEIRPYVDDFRKLKGYKWNVSVGMLDQVFNDSHKKTIRKALRLLLKYDSMRLLPPEKRTWHYQDDLENMINFSEGELKAAAEKIEKEAENRGEEKIKGVFEEQTGKPLIIDVNRGWGMLTNDPELKRLTQYKNLQGFLVECGLDYVEPDTIRLYTGLLEKYQESLPTLSCVVPDERLMLARIAIIVGEKANIVGAALIYNIKNVPSGYVNIVLKVEAGSEEVEELKTVLDGMAEKFRQDRKEDRND